MRIIYPKGATVEVVRVPDTHLYMMGKQGFVRRTVTITGPDQEVEFLYPSSGGYWKNAHAFPYEITTHDIAPQPFLVDKIEEGRVA